MLTLEQLQAGLVIPIDKPRCWTSFQAVNKVKSTLRRLYGIKNIKIGHAGTLDPLATGLLLVCLGKATKRIAELQDGDKVYTATLVLGATTPCYDLERPIDAYYPYEHITRPMLEQAIEGFVGTIEQVPPIFSAVKINGQRAYQYARADNPDASPTPKPVHIHSIAVTDFRTGTEPPADSELQTQNSELPTSHLYNNPQGTVPGHLPQANLRIHCGKGTYIRSLARDLGLALGSGAFLSALRREQVGSYTVDRALQLEQVDPYLANLAPLHSDEA